ncbi:uncharacterized protein LOC122951098 [Acropora millepora]|uniref:uncharacterized protein LOC122951098 n=1 Tax=Acropora millepora TaxID=45264 RepID=UPI001CF59691|nr:uncharacterized protein LOC122951098 [Acropora millepora]
MPDQGLSAKELRRIWNDEFLPSVRREIKTEILELKSSIKALVTERCNELEKSQDFVFKKYHTAIAALQSVKSEISYLDKKHTTIVNSLEEKLGELAGTTDRQDQSLYRVESALDETQQYLRRDCLEINGVPISSYENPNQLVKEVGLLAGVEIDDRHIATAHKLPDSKNVKNRLIVKFIQRDKREELYKHRKNLVGKNISHLPSVEDGNGKIFINESLTSYRKRLFGRIREYKRNNNLKCLWTSNSKIMLKVNDTSPTQAFVTHEQFEDYLDQISNH